MGEKSLGQNYPESSGDDNSLKNKTLDLFWYFPMKKKCDEEEV